MSEKQRLHFETVSALLRETLDILMQEPSFAPFRLVGGTNLSLRFGHRISVDIDLFTDAEYRSLDFRVFETFLKKRFPYYECTSNTSIVGEGKSYHIGKSINEHIKIDLMYADPFLEQAEIIDGIRMAGTKDIIAMKMNVVTRGGRKKDFWDLHRLLHEYPLSEMLDLHAQRYKWEHNEKELLKKFTDFTEADNQPDPICLQLKDWDEIKLDLIDEAENYSRKQNR